MRRDNPFAWVRAGPGTRGWCLLLASLVIWLVATPATAHAQATIRGTVTDAAGQPLSSAQVFIRALGVSTLTQEDGTYELFVPAARMVGVSQVEVTARRIGVRALSLMVTLTMGGVLTVDFALQADPFELEALVVTGQGLAEERAKLAVAISSVPAQEILDSKETNLVAALAGKVPNVEVTKSTGDPGGGTYIRIRGSKSISGGTQPLMVVDGVPILNESNTIESTVAGTAYQNRAADINAADIESIEILKGAAAAIYGSRAANGVVLVTTKSGQRNTTRMSLATSYSFDKVNKEIPLQRSFGQGLDLTAIGGTGVSVSSVTWGAPLASGTTTYDHWNELFRTGHQWDNTLSLTGGTDRTTYYLSLGFLDHKGVIQGNSDYQRITSRLRGQHDFAQSLTVGASVQYTSSDADLVQQGSNISGLLLGGARTPPEFNNLPYIDPETGLHRSYRCQTGVQNPACQTNVSLSRGYDNPFWIANEILNTADVDRVFGNVSIDWDPIEWLNLRYTLGADYSHDQRLTLFPKSSSDFPTGRIIRATLVDELWDHSLLATVTQQPSEDLAWSLTLGQNLIQQKFRRYQTNASELILGTEQLDFTITRTPNEFISTVRTDGYFAQGTVDIMNQLYLSGLLRYDGSNTFGGDVDTLGNQESSRFWYPKASVAWDVTRYLAFFDFAKLRFAWGTIGTQPPIYSNVSAFGTATLTDGWLSPNGLNTVYGGLDGVVSQGTLGNAFIEPEKTTEIEMGGDLTLLDSRVQLGVTYYRDKTTAAIMNVPLAPSTGYFSKSGNGATWRNWGWELTLDLRPVQTPDFVWQVSAQWARNKSIVDTLLGTEELGLNGFIGSTASVVQGQPFPVMYGDDWIRFGRGSIVDGVDIDATYAADSGTIYIHDDGLPIMDPQERVIADLNPEWTAGIRNTITLFGRVRVSALLDFRKGGFTWNGTRGALTYFGTHASTEEFHGDGLTTVIGSDLLDPVNPDIGVAGPGAGQEVTLNWGNWNILGPGSGFTGPATQFVEPSGFIKLRDISVAFTLDQPWVQRIGFSTIDVTLSGRNLWTETDYTGIDPEANLTGQSTGRGLDYFNNPQTRSFVIAFTLTR